MRAFASFVILRASKAEHPLVGHNCTIDVCTNEILCTKKRGAENRWIEMTDTGVHVGV